MSTITLDQALAELTNWRNALASLRVSQSYTYSHGGTTRSYTRADLPEVREMVDYWQRYVNELTAAQAGAATPGFMVGAKNYG